MLSFLIILVLLGAVLEILSLRRDPSLLEMEYELSTGATEPGSPFTVQTVLTNRSRIPLSYVAVRELFPPQIELPNGVETRPAANGLLVKNIYRMKGLQRKRQLLELSASRRGVYMFTGESVELGDFLGFRMTSKTYAYQRELVVYPRALDDPGLSQALSSFCGDLAAQRFLIRDPILTAGVREYTGREPMKEIHWPQSARHGGLMVREFEYSRQPSACVLLNVEDADDALDHLCSVTRTVCQTLVDAGASLSFYTNSRLRRRERREAWRCEASQQYMGTLLEGLGRATAGISVTAEDLLRTALRECDSDTALILVSPADSDLGARLTAAFRQTAGREILLISG